MAISICSAPISIFKKSVKILFIAIDSHPAMNEYATFNIVLVPLVELLHIGRSKCTLITNNYSISSVISSMLSIHFLNCSLLSIIFSGVLIEPTQPLKAFLPHTNYSAVSTEAMLMNCLLLVDNI